MSRQLLESYYCLYNDWRNEYETGRNGIDSDTAMQMALQYQFLILSGA
jgi:hypothetical protein